MVIYVGYDKYKSLMSYRYGQLKENGLWNIAMRTVKYTRRYFLISRLIRYASYIIAIIETSATLIVLFTALVIAIPILLISFLITALLSVSQCRRYNSKVYADIISADKIAVIDAKKGYYRKKQAYLNRMAKCFRDEGYTVFVVSHSFRNDRFLVARHEGERLWIIKLHYLFIIKKKFKDNITYIY